MDGFIPFRNSDYANLTEEDGELYYSGEKSKKRKKMSKEAQMLGIWGEDEDESNEEIDEARMAFDSKYSRPLNFIESNNQSKLPKEKERREDDNMFLREEEDSHRGLGAGGGGLGFSNNATSAQDDFFGKFAPNAGQGLGAGGGGGLGYQGGGFQRERGGNQGAAAPAWEKFSTGIGSKLLQKMGWSAGKGLGKDGTGIVAPIEVIVRPKNQGLSYKGFQERTEQSIRDFDDPDALGFRQNTNAKDAGTGAREEAEDPYVELQSYWKKNKDKRPKQKTVYEATAASAKTKIIDMRGPSVAVVDSLDQVRPVKVPYLPELYHNLQILVEMKQVSLHTTGLALRQDTQTLQRLQREEQGLKATLAREDERVDTLEDALSLVEQGVAATSLSSLYLIIDDLQSLHAPLWQAYGLVSLLFHSAIPLFRKEFQGWKPLADPEHGADTLLEWRVLMDPVHAWHIKQKAKAEEEKEKERDAPISPLQALIDFDKEREKSKEKPPEGPNAYYAALEEIVIPAIKQSLMYDWNPQQDALKAARMVSVWLSVLPEHLHVALLDHLVVVRLRMEVERWNPSGATTPVADWLGPWNALIPDRLTLLWPLLLDKLSMPQLLPALHPFSRLGDALRVWKPHDSTVCAMLRPLRAHIPSALFESFLFRTILPKLRSWLQAFQINPAQQEMNVWVETMKWIDFFPQATLVGLVHNDFFPNWFATLYTWLSQSPKLDEVSRWYIGWKQQIPEPLVKDPAIVRCLNHALEMMRSAVVKGSPLMSPPAWLPLGYGRATDSANSQAARAAERSRPTEVIDLDEKEDEKDNAMVLDANLTFKEIIERLAAQYGVLFMPTKRMHESKQIFSFGKVSIYLDKNLLYCNVKGRWTPMGIDELLALAL